MSDATPTETEIAAFADRHGLQRLSPDDLERMRQFAPGIARLGRAVPRVEAKQVTPWPPRRPGTD